MKAKLIQLLVVCLVVISTVVGSANLVLAEDPLAQVLGPDTSQLGHPVWIKTEGSTGKSFQWTVIPEEAAEDFIALPVYAGQGDDGVPIIQHVGHFSSSDPGIYYFIFVATEGDNSSVAVHKLINGEGGPEPNPDDVPDVDPQPLIPDPVKPDPVKPDPVKPDPVKPDPVKPDPIKPEPAKEKVPVVIEPSSYLKKLVTPITESLTGKDAKKDALDLAWFYWDMGDGISRDSGSMVKTTEDIRTLNVRAGGVMFQQKSIKGKYKGLPEAVDNALIDVLELKSVKLSDGKRAEAVQVFKAISWACLEVLK
jgi:hypothetical protein